MAIGVMQGRLSPPEDGRHQCFPRTRWRDEFPLAALAGLAAIEWIWDAQGADVNPLARDDGVREIRTLSERHGVPVRSVCADYFMTFPMVRASVEDLAGRRAEFAWLINRCSLAGIGRIVLPVLDASRIETAEDQDNLIAALNFVLPVAERVGVGLHLETSLAPGPFAALLAELPHPLVKVNYDSGNSASLGYRPADEFRAYGSRMGSIHIKDRIRGGATVPLGSGNADFAALARLLREARFSGDFVLEAARGEPGDEVAWCRANREFAETKIVGGNDA